MLCCSPTSNRTRPRTPPPRPRAPPSLLLQGESDPLLILAAAGAGSLAYYVAEPFFPKMDEGHDHLAKVCGLGGLRGSWASRSQTHAG